MLKKLVCSNYRSLEYFELDFSPMTVLVGSNGVGKSTVLSAIEFLLGDRWPSLAQLDIPGDFTVLDNTRTLRIQAWFDPVLIYEDAMDTRHDVGAIEFACQPYRRRAGDKVPGDLREICRPLDPSGSEIVVCTRRPQKGQRPTFLPLTSLSSGLREQARILSISEARSVSSQLPGRRGSILARLLSEARRSFLRNEEGERTAFATQYSSAVDTLRTSQVQDIEASIEDTARRMLGFKGSASASRLGILFGFADPGNPYSALRLLCRQGDLTLPAEALGLGEQSAIVVGLFEAFRQRGTVLNTITIEEPEMYLHPQAQRYFKRLLTDIVDQQHAQIVLSTHSTIFADMGRFREVRLMKRNSVGRSEACRIDRAEDQTFLDEQLAKEKLTQYMDAQTGELLFATGVLLVEGHGDRLAVKEVAEKLTIDLDAEGLSVIDCGGKNAIPFFARICRALRIPFVVLHDLDIYEGDSLYPWQENENQRAPAVNALIAEASGTEAPIFQVAPNLEHSLGVGRGASDKPRLVYAATKQRSLDDLPAGLVGAVNALASFARSSNSQDDDT
jgi:putative ATP-dependent endonuclease of the OLD family